MWETLSDAIIAKILTSTQVDPALVYDYSISQIDGFPAITVTPSTGTGEFADNLRNRREYVFSVRVYQERMNQGEDGSERIMRSVVNDLLSILDGDLYLGDSLAGRGFTTPGGSTWSFIQGEQINIRMVEILLTATVIQ